MKTLEELASNEEIKKEYKKTFLLNILKKMIEQMRRDNVYKQHIFTLFKQSTDKIVTTKILLNRDFNYNVSEEDAKTFKNWLNAHFNKGDKRKSFSESFKKEIFNQQKGLCAVCGEKLEEDFSKIHLDHIIPWTLVGDELQDNYQFLCKTCNECKSCHTDYIFKSLINLI